jgi:hypothetical protein
MASAMNQLGQSRYCSVSHVTASRARCQVCTRAPLRPLQNLLRTTVSVKPRGKFERIDQSRLVGVYHNSLFGQFIFLSTGLLRRPCFRTPDVRNTKYDVSWAREQNLSHVPWITPSWLEASSLTSVITKQVLSC